MKVTRSARPLITLLAVAITGLASVLTSGVAFAAPAPRDSGSQPIYSYANAIRETAWVDTGLKDPRGKAVRVAADIVRPSEPASQGKTVPTIMDASPYYSCCGRGNESQLKTYDSAGKPVQFPLYYDNYFVPRGYAIVLVDLAGTNRSNGCVDLGGPSDITSAKAVVDWLNGRATGYTSATGATTVSATKWSNGSVGMIGKSYDGTIANGVAATGVAGLKTIVPISAISSWYDYYRASGAPLTSGAPSGLTNGIENSAAQSGCSSVQQAINSGAPGNGNYTSFWAQRNYFANAANVHASVFVAHGVNDLNVKTINFGQWWNALAANGVQRKIWLSQTGHVDPFDYRRADWVDTLHRWFDHYLMGVDNGVDRDPVASIERTPDHWVDDATWPVASGPTTLKLAATTTNGLGKLGSAPAPGTVESFTDNHNQGESDWTANPNSASAARVLFSSGTLASDVRVSGTSSITVTATSSTSSARLSAVLVDLGPETIRNFEGSGEGITTLSSKSCWGDSTSGDSACFKDAVADTTDVNALVISRGWADLGHYASLNSQQSLTPGKAYTMTFNLATTDHVVAAGHKLALIIAGTDADNITAGSSSPKVTVDLTNTTVKVPLVGTLPK